ncbi:unnamed protein product [Ceutorhynchus assimilis]|uniref:Uncharacterized protein n=1 Tax=Ceutorhynchus assimilis TaxID=467358 RepID=A0A9N9MGA3_9CUCU|nr:unnamed protein product [Ceutorhynchus assimilis]
MFCGVSAETSNQHVELRESRVNPKQLFHGLLCVVRDDDGLKEYLRYELAAKPPALFDGTLVRNGTKSGLIDALEEIAPPVNNFLVSTEYTVDGGFLLQRVAWARPANFSQICLHYVRYVKNHLGQKANVVFDDYESPSTKDEEHTKRNATGASTKILIDDGLP